MTPKKVRLNNAPTQQRLSLIKTRHESVVLVPRKQIETELDAAFAEEEDIHSAID